MDLVERYVREVGKYLPLRGKKDVMLELAAGIHDGIEARYGSEPSEKETLAALAEFGSPRLVAKKYSAGRPLIAPALEDAYRLIIAVMAFGIAVGFLVTLIVSLIRDASAAGYDPSVGDVLGLLGSTVARTFTAILSGTGALTLTFIGLSRLPDACVSESLVEPWNPEDLKGLEPDNPIPSRIECAVTAAVIATCLVLVNVWPELASLAERAVGALGLTLAHSIEVARLTLWVRVASFLWLAEALYHVMLFSRQRWTAVSKALEIAVKAATPALSFAMFADRGLYAGYRGMLGFRLLFLIGAIGGLIAFVKYSVVEIRRKIEAAA